MKHYDLVIVGGGIVGAACASRLLAARPSLKVLLLEKERQPASHQTGRNSGVIHAGVYYPPGSLKARYCREGLERTIAYCQQHQLPFLQCGKLIVATDADEEARLESLYGRCQENQLAPQWLMKSEVKKREPNIAGESAIYVQQTGITCYTTITRHLLHQFEQAGGVVHYGQQVQRLEEHPDWVSVATEQAQYQASILLNCAGLHSDTLIRQLLPDIDWRIVPFKGEYYVLPPKHNQLVQHLIYPTPDPTLPFLGVHLTRMIDGSVTVGPSAILALGKEAYGKTEVELGELLRLLGYSGLRKVMKKHWRSGLREFQNALSKRSYLKSVQKYCPRIQLKDLRAYPSGIRAQAVSDSGELIHDFRFAESARSLHVGNAPSPAATSAMPIADAIFDKLKDKL